MFICTVNSQLDLKKAKITAVCTSQGAVAVYLSSKFYFAASNLILVDLGTN